MVDVLPFHAMPTPGASLPTDICPEHPRSLRVREDVRLEGIHVLRADRLFRPRCREGLADLNNTRRPAGRERIPPRLDEGNSRDIWRTGEHNAEHQQRK